MKSKRIIDILLFLSLGIFIFGTGYKIGEYNGQNGSRQTSNVSITNFSNSQSKNQQVKNLDFSLFWDTWDQLDQKYVDKKKLDVKKMYYGAIKGMVASVEDPYTFFLTPDENKQTKDDLGGKFEGIGAQLGLKENKIVVVAPLKNSPAEKAGVKAGDYVNKVEGTSTKGWTLPQAVSKIRGDKGSKVTLTFERNGKEFDLTLMRDTIVVSPVELSYETPVSCPTCGKIAYLKMNQFGDNTNRDWEKYTADIAEKWQNKEIKGMVLDLRDNPGGYLESAVYTASEFIPTGKVVVKQESTTTSSHTYESIREGKLLDIPLVVLINKGSASASEILSGALRDYGRAKLIGEKSFGKGSVQEALDLKDGAGLHVTVAKWILPKGDWINGKGIEPEIKVTLQEPKEGNTLTKETDNQLQTALEQIGK
ncbi:S41 family peptidase [Candidatus Roizmanbacteria bacterium]|nr:S41 family peptidase [Candidatus Roizmanbacteria bacterium]